MKRSLVALLAVVLVGGCGTPLMPTPVGVPENPGAEMRPDLIVAEPVQVEPGGIAALTFPALTTRGILFTLDLETAGEWRTVYFLTSDGPGPEWERTWSRAGGAGLAVEDIGVGGPGPDQVLIPDIAEPGSYRICTANAAEVICAPIEVVAP